MCCNFFLGERGDTKYIVLLVAVVVKTIWIVNVTNIVFLREVVGCYFETKDIYLFRFLE